MYDPFLIVPGSLKHVVRDGDVVGFGFEARCGYYRRLILSMVEDLAVTVDGIAFPRDAVELGLHGKRWRLDELEHEYHEAWEFGEPADLVVLGPRLADGQHRVGIREQLRISYLPRPEIAEHEQVERIGGMA